MIAVIFGLLAALTNGAQALVSKRPHVPLSGTPAHRRAVRLQLPGAAAVRAVRALALEPGDVWLLHLVSAGLMVVTAICVWDMFDKGAASSTTTASALSPIAAVTAAVILLPGTFSPGQAAGGRAGVRRRALGARRAHSGIWGDGASSWRVIGGSRAAMVC